MTRPYDALDLLNGALVAVVILALLWAMGRVKK